MKPPRWRELLDQITASQQRDSGSFSEALCREALTIVNSNDVTLTVTVGDSFTVVAATSARAVMLDEEQFTLGLGPTFNNARGDLPVLVPSIQSGLRSKWGAFGEFAIAHGIHSCFCFPVRIGEARIGVLTFYRETTGSLTAAQYSDGLILASLTADDLIHASTQLDDAQTSPLAVAGLSNTSEIHQAAGMIAEQFNCSFIDALVRLRAMAYARGEPLSLIAKQIVQRTLHFDE